MECISLIYINVLADSSQLDEELKGAHQQFEEAQQRYDAIIQQMFWSHKAYQNF